MCGTHPTVTKLIDYEQFCGIHPAAPETAAVTAQSNATEITSVELKQRLDRGDKLTLVDVREPNEYQINRIPGPMLIPLGEMPRRYAELDPDDEIVVHCKMGGTERQGGRFPAIGRVQEGAEPQGRDPRLDRQGRPDAAEILNCNIGLMTVGYAEAFKKGGLRADGHEAPGAARRSAGRRAPARSPSSTTSRSSCWRRCCSGWSGGACWPRTRGRAAAISWRGCRRRFRWPTSFRRSTAR